MAYDEIIHMMGEFGPYQRRILLLLCLLGIPCGIHTMAGVFLAAQPDFRCLLPHESPENATYQLPLEIIDVTYPWDNETKKWPQCERYDSNFTHPYNASGDGLSSTPATVKCDAFVYDKTTYEVTTTTEFNVVCGNAWLKATADSTYLVGMLFGSSIFGGLSDRYGRKPILYWVLTLLTFSGLLVAASPEIISYMILRMIVGAAVLGTYQISYVCVVEMVVPERRLLVGIGTQIFFSLGHILVAAFAYFIKNWRYLQVAMTIPNLAFLVYWWYIPESSRWLITAGRLEEAKDSIQKAALENGVELSRDRLDSMLKNCTTTNGRTDLEKPSMFDLFRYPNLRRKTLLLFLIWFVSNSTYYGLSWNTASLAGNVYLNYAISSLVEMPAHIFLLVTMNRWGRRHILCGTTLLTGISLLSRIFVPDDIPWLEVVLTMIGKLAISASFAAVYVFASEQFPTVIRNVGMGACSTCAMIGGIMSSYINYSSVFWKPSPVVIFGVGSLIAGLSTLLLPETLNEKLPDTIEDCEQFGKKSTKSDNTLRK